MSIVMFHVKHHADNGYLKIFFTKAFSIFAELLNTYSLEPAHDRTKYPLSTGR